MNDITNRLNSECPMDSAKKWKQLACAVGNSGESMIMFNDEDRRPVLEITDERVLKKKRVAKGGMDNKENFQVATEIQHQRSR